MKPVKSFIYLLCIILFYSYIVFFFKFFHLESSFNLFVWILVLVCTICIAMVSYYPIHLKQAGMSSYLIFFSSLCYTAFLASAIFCSMGSFASAACAIQPQALYLVSLCILLIFLTISYAATAFIFSYPHYAKRVTTLFAWLLIVEYVLFLYFAHLFELESFLKVLTRILNPLVILLILVHSLVLLGLYAHFRYITKKFGTHVAIDFKLYLLHYGTLFIFYADMIWGNHPILSNLCLITLLLLSTYATMRYTLRLLNKYIDAQLLPYKENASLMNQYYLHISKTNAQLDQRFHHMDSVYKQILACYPDAYFVLLDFNICDTNEFGMKLMKCSHKDALIGEDFLSYVAPKDHAKLRKLLQKLPQTNIPVNSDFEMITKEGESLYVEGSFILADLYDHPSILVTLRDLSFHKETYDLQRQIEMERLKVEFFSTISHELKTPVNIIYSASQLQETFIKNQQFDNLETYSQMITHNCLRLLRLLNNLLDISRLESNYFSVKAEPINIVALCESLLGSIVPYAGRKQISCVFDTDEEEIYCHLDPDLLERILLNLLSNAVKYGRDHGHIDVILTCSADQAHIHVKDDGVGIPEEKLSYIFDRFMRVENGLIRSAEGSGIGLSLVKSLVEKQNGQIDVISQIDHGSEFIVSFPLIEAPHQLLDLAIPEIASSKIELEFSDVFHSGE